MAYQDGSKVWQGSSPKKAWRILDIGTVPWEDGCTNRVNAWPCRSSEAMKIPLSAPGRKAAIAVWVRAPSEPGKHHVYCKVIGARGRTPLTLKRPVLLSVQVGQS
ncbi:MULTISPECIES: NBR1-Ig-like domain-containing protein [unclassified Streptosporangium]|uniref:NBR1-Ig-like domain-containing protein n=1 Tax=unclassified Streptosporangium TaxID=2632669 RepID=UPI003FA368BE